MLEHVRVKDLVAQGLLSVTDGHRMRSDQLGDNGTPFIRGGDIQGGGIRTDDAPCILPTFGSLLRAKMSRPFDSVFISKGTVGRAGLVREGQPPVVFSPQVSRWRSEDFARIDPRFLYYFICSKQFQDALFAVMSSGAMAADYVSLVRQLDFEFEWPAEGDRRAIGAVLGALDDKIELNRAMNATLEEMARGLFRSWFVDFDPVHARAAGEAPAGLSPETAALFPDSFAEDGLPVGWRMGRLGDIAVAPKRGVKPDAIDPSTPYIGLEHMPRRSVALDAWEAASKVGSQKSMMRQGEFLFGKLRPYFHKVGIVPVDGICSTDIVVVAPKDAEWAGFVLSVISSDAFVDHTNASSSGTRMPRTNWRDMAAFEVALPSTREAAAFERICNPMRQRIVANIHESRTLAELRDALLPRLMSGELRVREAEEMTEALL